LVGQFMMLISRLSFDWDGKISLSLILLVMHCMINDVEI